MRLRPFRESDIETIDRIWKEHHANDFSVPDRSTALIDTVVEDDNGVLIGYGQVKLFAEAMMILDLGRARIEKAKALKLLIHEAIRGMRLAKLKDLYMFVKDPDFALLVERHFGFDRVDDPGELLLRKD